MTTGRTVGVWTRIGVDIGVPTTDTTPNPGLDTVYDTRTRSTRNMYVTDGTLVHTKTGTGH